MTVSIVCFLCIEISLHVRLELPVVARPYCLPGSLEARVASRRPRAAIPLAVPSHLPLPPTKGQRVNINQTTDNIPFRIGLPISGLSPVHLILTCPKKRDSDGPGPVPRHATAGNTDPDEPAAMGLVCATSHNGQKVRSLRAHGIEGPIADGTCAKRFNGRRVPCMFRGRHDSSSAERHWRFPRGTSPGSDIKRRRINTGQL